MKKFTQFFLVFTISSFFVLNSCQKNEIEENITDRSEQSFLKSSNMCGEPVMGTLVEYDEPESFGDVIIENDETMLYVTFQTFGDYSFNSTYLYVGPADSVPGDLFPNNTGDFSPWAFPLYEWHGPGTQSYMFTIDLSTLDDCFIVVAYSNIEDLNDEYIVYGKALTKSLGYYMDYCKQDCETSPPLGCPKLAFAHGDDIAICFKDIKRNGTIYPSGNGTWYNFMLWGWTNGELPPGNYVLDLWAGSQSCDPENGILVGTVTFDYDGSTANVTYNVNPVYTLKSTYLYVGNRILPKKWRKFRVAPLFYPKKHYQVNSTTDSFTVNNLSGDVYIAASAIVKDAE
jgi:hypothetical protein